MIRGCGCYDQGFNWIHTDHLGSGHKMTNTAGAVVFTEQYDPHGQRLMQTSNNGAMYLSKKFTGYERDYGTNTDNAKARQYHPMDALCSLTVNESFKIEWSYKLN